MKRGVVDDYTVDQVMQAVTKTTLSGITNDMFDGDQFKLTVTYIHDVHDDVHDVIFDMEASLKTGAKGKIAKD